MNGNYGAILFSWKALEMLAILIIRKCAQNQLQEIDKYEQTSSESLFGLKVC
ncbi:hypothetical protein FACS1894113_5230 [Alphaproteobacteria bacterium]|nr:hypothetical protein FACS1894113_5230 [Alphaproteobacteria bacterium]